MTDKLHWSKACAKFDAATARAKPSSKGTCIKATAKISQLIMSAIVAPEGIAGAGAALGDDCEITVSGVDAPINSMAGGALEAIGGGFLLVLISPLVVAARLTSIVPNVSRNVITLRTTSNMVSKMPLIFFCAMAQILSVVECSASGGTTAFETVPPSFESLVTQNDAVLMNRTRVNKAKVVEQHGSVGHQIRRNPFEQFDLIGEETSMVRGTCDLEKDQVKNLNERNTNLKAQLDAMREENEELKRPLLGPALSSSSVRTEAQTMGTTKKIANGVVLDNVRPTNDDKLDHLASNVACQDHREECPLGKTGTTMLC